MSNQANYVQKQVHYVCLCSIVYLFGWSLELFDTVYSFPRWRNLLWRFPKYWEGLNISIRNAHFNLQVNANLWTPKKCIWKQATGTTIQDDNMNWRSRCPSQHFVKSLVNSSKYKKETTQDTWTWAMQRSILTIGSQLSSGDNDKFDLIMQCTIMVRRMIQGCVYYLNDEQHSFFMFIVSHD